MGGTLKVPETRVSRGVRRPTVSIKPGASATGDTLRDVPTIKTRSTRSLSSSSAWSKSFVSFSPKKVMSGYMSHRGSRGQLAVSRVRLCGRRTFMIPGG